MNLTRTIRNNTVGRSLPYKGNVQNKVLYASYLVRSPLVDTISFGSTNLSKLPSQERKYEIIEAIENNNKENTIKDYKVISDGTTSINYKVGENGIIVKIPRTERLGDMDDPTLHKEAFALKYIKELGLEDSQEYVDLIQKNGKTYLFSTFVDGKGFGELDIKKDADVIQSALKDLVKKLFFLELRGFQHCDLQCDNICIDSGKAKLIDFGSFQILQNDGNYMISDEIASEFFTKEIKEIEKELKLDDKNHRKFLQIYRPHLNESGYCTRSNNPHFRLLSNVENFEYRGLHWYLSNLINEQNKTKEAQQLFDTFLHIKAQDYHAPMADFLESLKTAENIEEIAKSMNKTKDEAYGILTKAIQHEKISATLLGQSEISEAVKKTEVARMQLRQLISQGIEDEEGNYSISLAKKLKGAFDDYRKMISDFAQRAQGESKIYFENALELPKWCKWIEDRCVDADGAPLKTGETLPDNENLLKTLFKKFEQNTEEIIEKPDVVQPETLKKGMGKKYGIIAIACALIGLSVYLYNKYKKRKTINSNEIQKLTNMENKNTNTKTSATNAILSNSNTTQNPYSHFNNDLKTKGIYKDFL